MIFLCFYFFLLKIHIKLFLKIITINYYYYFFINLIFLFFYLFYTKSFFYIVGQKTLDLKIMKIKIIYLNNYKTLIA